MRVHYLQHVIFEGLGSIGPILRERGHQLTSTHLYEFQKLPPISDIDWLIVMGGPMGVYDDGKYNWLRTEKRFIEKVIKSGKIVLGICLGAQIISDVLGARVYKNKYREIGWFHISRLPDVDRTVLSPAIPQQVEVFHWHSDTFDIPGDAISLAKSDACKNQGFIWHDRIIGFQFHLETTWQSARVLLKTCRNELDGSRYVQTEKEILSDHRKFKNINRVMQSVLDVLEKSDGK